MSLRSYFGESIRVLESASQAWAEDVAGEALKTMSDALGGGKPLLVCGNGGSAADAMHITGELVGRFLIDRQALNVICLAANPAVLTAWANDCSFETVFSRQVEAYGQLGAALIGISTSGNSPNVLAAFERARSMGMKTIALTGEGGGRLASVSDYLFAVPSRSKQLVTRSRPE